MPEAAIEIVGAGKRYVKYDDAPTLVGRAATFARRTHRSRLWALRDIDLEMPRGACVGVIGRNGSGKSTLLQMMAGVTAPTEGRVTVRGSVAPLISVGVGFHPELTGRENVYVNGMILGLSRQDLDARFDAIVDFAEIHAFIDTPVKFYSSGMFVRLGFAVAVNSSPDILLIDEVLAVGDLAFQMKCFDRMQEIRESGTTIVVVSHSLNAIRRLCDITAVLDRGRLEHYGDTASAIALVHDLLGAPFERNGADGANTAEGSGVEGSARIDHLATVERTGTPGAFVESGHALAFDLTVSVTAPVEAPVVNFRVFHESGVLIYAEPIALGGNVAWTCAQRFRIVIDTHLATGSYSADATLLGAGGTVLSAPRSVAFYVDGRATVKGLNDLGARIEIVTDPDPGS